MYICFYTENCHNFVVFKTAKDIVFIDESRRGWGWGGFGGSNLLLFYFEHMTCYKTFYIYLKAIFPSIIILYKCFKKLSYLKKVVQWTNVIYILKKKWSSPSLWLFSQIKGTLTPHTQTDLLYPKSSLNLLL